MSMLQAEAMPRDWRDLDLSPGGRSLIEASAGTGKTWTIGLLYLRLILEQAFTPRQIVVTTFTNAAADELRRRLRQRLRWAESRASDAANSVMDIEPSDETWLRERWSSGDTQRVSDLQKLRVALAELDMAPITTLHGLCQRILSDRPFAAGVPFNGGDLVSIDDLVEGIARDLLRRIHQGDAETDPLVRLQQAMKVDINKEESLGKRLQLLLRPGSTVYCLGDMEIRQRLPEEWAGKLRRLCARDELFNKSCSLRNYWNALADLIEDPPAALPTRHTDKALAKAEELKDVSKVGKRTPEVIEAALFSKQVADSGIIEYLREHKARKFWFHVAEWARAQVRSRLASLNQRTFDELLATVHDAISGDGGPALADALFAAWPVALVDEFQDTDSLQYGILDRIVTDVDGNKRGRLVMIGDPKQAIYRFRGGDIHAYLTAAKKVDARDRITLDTNRRSSRAFVAAVNEFHEAVGTQLGAEASGAGIHYVPVKSCDRQDKTPYRISGDICRQPLVIHGNRDCPESAGDRLALALEFCANQIADMLASGQHVIGDKPVRASDIAVLLPANHQLDTLRDLLRAHGVPSVTTARDSVFATDSARELLVILHAVVHCTELGPLRAAVATRLWGYDYAKLRELGDDPVAWQGIVKIFHGWRAEWQYGGILTVVNAVIDQIAGRQLAASAGERVLTDLRHLGELLQAKSADLVGDEELLAWFSRQRDAKGADGEEAADARQLRMESDARRVRLMTLHASKGLEFPIVFLPLMWNHAGRSGPGLYQTTREDGTRRTDVTDKAKEAEKLDLQDERFRILYVAMTRAIHACHLFALPVDRPAKKGGKPAVGMARSALDVLLGRMQPALGTQALADKTPHIRWVDGWHRELATDQAAIVDDQEERQPARHLPARRTGPLPGRHSFTTLTQGLHRNTLAPDASAGDEDDVSAISSPFLVMDDPALPSRRVAAEPHPVLLELASVKGADFGNAVHAVFEHRQPGVALASQSELLQRQLAEYNVRSRDGRDQPWLVRTLSRRLQQVLDTPLGSDAGIGPRLADLPSGAMRAEMEFFFALDGTSMDRLRDACIARGEPSLVPSGQHGHHGLAGLMNGKIDLVFEHDGRFHVLDYKGNYLGDRLDDYRGDSLIAQMDASHYRFQALLYAVALDRYLRQRIHGYERRRHLGDCYYIFIRAVGLDENSGIWRHRFSDELIDAVQSVLASSTSKAIVA